MTQSLIFPVLFVVNIDQVHVEVIQTNPSSPDKHSAWWGVEPFLSVSACRSRLDHCHKLHSRTFSLALSSREVCQRRSNLHTTGRLYITVDCNALLSRLANWFVTFIEQHARRLVGRMNSSLTICRIELASSLSHLRDRSAARVAEMTRSSCTSSSS